MRQHQPVLAVRLGGHGLDDRQQHEHRWTGADVRPGEDLDVVGALSEHFLGQALRLLGSRDLGQLHFEVGGRSLLADEAPAGEDDPRTRQASLDPLAQGDGVDRVGAGIDHRREAVAGDHVAQVLRQGRLGLLAGVGPLGLGEVDVAVPETGGHHLAAGVDHPFRRWRRRARVG